MDSRKEIIEKILKVYKKSFNNPFEEEAKMAVLKAQEMLAKYNLELKDIEIEEKEQVISISSGMKSRWWHGRLGIILAKNFRCKMYTQTGHGKKLVFIGLETDANICLKTFDYLKNCINYNCKEHLSKRRLRNKNNIKVAKESFIEGFILGLSCELNRQVQKNEWGLILSIPEEVHATFNDINFTGTVTYQRDNMKRVDEKAYSDGYVIGKEFDININKPLIE